MKHNIFSFHIEPVRGCTRRCDFCGILSILKQVETPTLMELSLAENIAKQIKNDFKEKLRIDFSLHGEPLMHPKIYEIVKIFRDTLPKAQLAIISNGDLIAKDKIKLKKLFDSGLNYLMLDFYKRPKDEEENLVDELLNSEDDGVNIYDYFKDKKSIWSYNSCKEKGIIVVKDLELTNSVTRKVHTAGGNISEGAFNKYKIDKSTIPMLRQCAKPFTELSVNADGFVSLCCEDWSRELGLGNVSDGDKLIDIWDSEKMEQYRYLLNQKRRDLIPVCNKCNQVSFRTGLYKPLKQFPQLIKKLENEKI